MDEGGEPPAEDETVRTEEERAAAAAGAIGGPAPPAGENRWDPETDAFSPEEEADDSSAVYGEPDEVDPTEVTRDPREGSDDPGAGPGIAPER